MRCVSLAGVVAGLIALTAPVVAQDKKPEVRAKLEGHRGGVTAIAFSRDGKLIATGAGNGIVFLWDAKTGEQLARLNENGGNAITGVALVALSPDLTLMTAASKGTIPYWDVSDPKAPKKLRNLGTSTDTHAGIGAAGDGAAFIYVPKKRPDYPSAVEFYAPQGTGSRSVDGPQRFDPKALACAPDADTQATAVYGASGTNDTPAVFLFGLGDVKTITRGVPALPKEGTPSIGYSPDGKWLGVCSGQFVVWKVPGSQIIGGEPILVVAADAHAGAVGPKDLAVTTQTPIEGQMAELTFWKLGTEARKIATHKTELADVRCLAFSPDGNTLAVGGYTDGVVQLWTLGEAKKAEEKQPEEKK